MKTTTFGKGKNAYTVPYDIKTEDYAATLEELNTELRRFMLDEYHYDMTKEGNYNIDVVFNGRLSSIVGAYVRKGEKPLYIEMSKLLMRTGTVDYIWDTFYHEAIHFACHIMGKDYRDGDDDFEWELRRHGVSSSGTGLWLGEVMTFKCGECRRILSSRRKKVWNNHTNFTSNCCGADFIPRGLEVFDGESLTPKTYYVTMKDDVSCSHDMKLLGYEGEYEKYACTSCGLRESVRKDYVEKYKEMVLR